MKIWIFTTKNKEEYQQIEENDTIKMASPKDVHIGDIILIYNQLNNNIEYIFESQRKAYEDKFFRPPWKIFVDLSSKIQLKNPLERIEIEKDSLLKEWSFAKDNFGGIFEEVPSQEWEHLKNLILNKNPESIEAINKLTIKKWFFVIDDSFYDDLNRLDEIVWSSPKDIKKDDIIFVYTAKPKGIVSHILKAITDPYEDIDESGQRQLLLKVQKEIKIPVPIELSELKDNFIIKKGWALKIGFLGSHFKMFQEEYDELKRLVLAKNHQLEIPLKELEYIKTGMSCFNDNHRGRAHVTRDVCYLVHENFNITEDVLTQLLIKNVGDNEDYWRAYFQNCIKENCVRYNIESARSLGLIDCDSLKLTGLGHELVNALEKDEVFTYNYGIGTKRFFYKLAQNDEIIKTAMDILKENESLRFWSPKCDRTQRVIWEYHPDNNDIVCDEKKYPECADCDHDVLNHVNQTSLVLETLKKTGKRSGFVFWFTSRVTPMHLTGQEPAYNGQTIYWDKKEDAIMQGQPIQDLFLKPEDIQSGLKLDSNIFEQVCGTLNSKKHIMLTGAPGTGKTDLAEAICKSVLSNRFSDGYILTTATSDWTTYDTIGGYMPSNDGKRLKFEEGKFLQAIKENKWLIIDEINRADIDKAFGQLFTVLSGQGVELPFKDGNKPIKIERIDDNRSYYDPETATYNVGNNWRIIATMNVFDKDYLFEMSYAFMRRFTFIYIDLPEDEDFQYLIYDKWGENVDDGYLFLIEGLLEINKHRPIGPAIFKDMVEYSHERHKISDQKDDYQNQIIKDTIISFILPQFEGLELQKIHDIWNKVLSKYDFQDNLKTRLEEISGTSLTKSSEENEE